MPRFLLYVGGLLLAAVLLLASRALWQLFQKEGSSRIYVYDYDWELKNHPEP